MTYLMVSLFTNYFASSISNNFKTQIGGIPYYDQRVRYKAFGTLLSAGYQASTMTGGSMPSSPYVPASRRGMYT